MYSVTVKLDASSLKKFFAGKTITVKNSRNGSDVKLEFDESHKKIYTKLHKNLKSSKGARLNIDDVDDIFVELEDGINGGSVLKSLKKGFNKAGKAITKGADYVKKNAGQAVETVKSVVPQGALNTALKTVADAGVIAGLTAVGAPELIPVAIPATHMAVNTGTSTFYANDFSKKQTKQRALNSLKRGATSGAKQTASEIIAQQLKSGSTNLANQINPPAPQAVPVAEPVKGYGISKKKSVVPIARRTKTVKNNFQHAGSFKPLTGSSILPVGSGSMIPLGKNRIPIM